MSATGEEIPLIPPLSKGEAGKKLRIMSLPFRKGGAGGICPAVGRNPPQSPFFKGGGWKKVLESSLSPFVKGGRGGFVRRWAEIPLSPPFSKGEGGEKLPNHLSPLSQRGRPEKSSESSLPPFAKGGRGGFCPAAGRNPPQSPFFKGGGRTYRTPGISLRSTTGVWGGCQRFGKNLLARAIRHLVKRPLRGGVSRAASHWRTLSADGERMASKMVRACCHSSRALSG